MSSLASKRTRASQRQEGRCHYCALLMLEGGPPNHPLACTAEHLIARRDGGSNAAANIVAAHRFCNRHRHTPRNPRTPEQHRAFVQMRVSKGRWFPDSFWPVVQGIYVMRATCPLLRHADPSADCGSVLADSLSMAYPAIWRNNHVRLEPPHPKSPA
ncbi:MAG TPA: HNH endonuclease [Ramlibacter sp.]|nr:HNH endonuclease [Ramlibacter sp.]